MPHSTPAYQHQSCYHQIFYYSPKVNALKNLFWFSTISMASSGHIFTANGLEYNINVSGGSLKTLVKMCEHFNIVIKATHTTLCHQILLFRTTILTIWIVINNWGEMFCYCLIILWCFLNFMSTESVEHRTAEKEGTHTLLYLLKL